MGVSVTTGSVETLMNHFGKDAFAAAIETITKERNLGLFCIVSIENDNEGQLKKGIMVHRSINSNS